MNRHQASTEKPPVSGELKICNEISYPIYSAFYTMYFPNMADDDLRTF